MVEDRRFRFIGMQFVRQKLKIFITWLIFIPIQKMATQNRKSWRAQQIGKGPKLQKIHFWNRKMGLVGSRNFLKMLSIQRLSHLPFEVRVTSLTSHSKGSLHIQRVREVLHIEIRDFENFPPINSA